MKKYNILIVWALLFCFTLSSTVGFAESVADRYTQIAPVETHGSGEYVHGAGYGKLLMRVLLFGAIPQQGIHYYPEGTDLLFAILYAGGYSDMTKLNGIIIRRRAVKAALKVDLEDLIEDGGNIPRLQDGDIINVQFNYRKFMQEFFMWTGWFTSVTGFIFALIALFK
ncbi:MAG: hypothetical protein HY537_13855 [Deltaproteobacteria bacterium]|nr:hypothetical protein [Deltaproteobacteria bacterium]